jgi:hypothetical protein
MNEERDRAIVVDLHLLYSFVAAHTHTHTHASLDGIRNHFFSIRFREQIVFGFRFAKLLIEDIGTALSHTYVVNYKQSILFYPWACL